MKVRPPGAGPVSRGSALDASGEGPSVPDGGVVPLDPRSALEPDGSPDPQAWLVALESQVGEDDVPPDVLIQWPSGLVLRHLAAWMSRPEDDRDGKVDRIAAFLHETGDPDRVRRWLVDLVQEQPIVDVYPLEIRTRIVERFPDFWTDTRMKDVFTNGAELVGPFEPGELIRLRIPVGLVMQSFALQGGGAPEYTLAPGPPGNYGLEWGAAGDHVALFQGEIRGETWIERRTFAVRDAPTSKPGW